MEITELYTADMHDAGAEMQIIDSKTGDLTDSYLMLVGIDSKICRTSQRKRQRKALEAMRNNKPIPDDEHGLVIDCTIGWRGFTHKGKEFKFDKVALGILFDKNPPVADQSDKFIADRSNFTKG